MAITSDEFTVYVYEDTATTCIDRFRVILDTGDPDERWAVSTGATGNHPQGVCLSTEYDSLEPLHEDEHLRSWDELPEPVQRVVENEKGLHRHAKAAWEKAEYHRLG